MPEHLLITPFFHGGALQGWVCNIAHVAESAAWRPGRSQRATEIYQEGLRLPR
jgi:N-methylhydantoinase B/oxoprolinase/acetone carboxylase alpha subunit